MENKENLQNFLLEVKTINVSNTKVRNEIRAKLIKVITPIFNDILCEVLDDNHTHAQQIQTGIGLELPNNKDGVVPIEIKIIMKDCTTYDVTEMALEYAEKVIKDEEKDKVAKAKKEKQIEKDVKRREIAEQKKLERESESE